MKKFLGLELKWWQTILFAAVLLSVWFVYYIILNKQLTIVEFNKALASNAFLFACFSMSLSSITYLFKKGQQLMMYRMHLGIVAFFQGLVHVLIAGTLYFLVANPPYPNYEFGHVWQLIPGVNVSNIIAYILGIIAILLFAFMALITLKYFILKLGGVLWRKLLRYSGYTALVAVMAHFLIKNLDIWLNTSKWGSLPPINLVFWLFGLLVISLRLIMWAKLSQKKTVVA